MIALNTALSITKLPEDHLCSAVTQLREGRVLVVECTWDELQWSTVVKIAAELGVEPSAALGRINDTGHVEITEPQRGARGFRTDASWSIETLTKHDLAKNVRLIVLELDGAAGTAQLDAYFASHSCSRALTSTLTTSNHFLLLMPRGHTRLPTKNGIHRSTDVPRFPVPFLSCWLHHRFPECDQELEHTLLRKLKQRDWDNEEALYGWLSNLPASTSLADLRQALDDSGEPKPLQVVRDALDRCDEKDAVLLTAVFAATYFPPLPQHDFVEAVSALLGDRIRKEESAVPGTASVEISLSSEWERSIRGVFRQGDLELRERNDGARIVGFRAAGAPRALKRELDAAPFFVDAHLQYLQSSGLLFSQSAALGDAVIELLVAACTTNPSRFTADWLLRLFGRRRLRAGAATSGEAEAPSAEEWISHSFLRVAKLLRRLLEGAKLESTKEGAKLESTKEGIPSRFPAVLSLVSNLIGTMLHRGPAMAITAIELAYCLRSAPDFDFWRWARLAAELPNEKLRKVLGELLGFIVADPAESGEAVKRLVSWLSDEGEDLSAAGNLAALALGSCLAGSFVHVSEDTAYQPAALISLLQERAASPAPEEALGDLLALLARHMNIEHIEPYYLATRLLPQELLKFLPTEAQQRQLNEFVSYWDSIRKEHKAAWQASTHRTALRLAMMLAAWQLSCALHPELMQKLASAAREHLRTDYRLTQDWISLFLEMLTRCESVSDADPALTSQQSKSWRLRIREHRSQLAELRRWLGKPSATPPAANATSADPHSASPQAPRNPL